MGHYHKTVWMFVSIHASSREDATTMRSMYRLSFGFNPRVLAGGRDLRASQCLTISVFQSTRPRGRTRQIIYKEIIMLLVSIHASSREDATYCVLCPHKCDGVSIHASSREDATDVLRAITPIFRFNPRVLAGGRDGLMMSRMQTIFCFNPRVLAGGRDIGCAGFQIHQNVSIHASSREDATRGSPAQAVRSAVSIHASSREDATNLAILRDVPSGVSIHASSREDATVHRSPPADDRGFNPRVLAGGRDVQL